MNTIPQMHQPASYRFRLQGRIAVDWADWLAEPVVRVDGAEAGTVTVVTGTVRDQAALFGLLSFVRDLGVPLVSVEFILE